MESTIDKLIRVCTRVILLLCILIEVATLKVDYSLIMMVVFLALECSRNAYSRDYTNFDRFLIIIVDVISIIQVSMVLVEKLI